MRLAHASSGLCLVDSASYSHLSQENDENLMDVGWVSVQARASIGCLDMFGLSDSATL